MFVTGVYLSCVPCNGDTLSVDSCVYIKIVMGVDLTIYRVRI